MWVSCYTDFIKSSFSFCLVALLFVTARSRAQDPALKLVDPLLPPVTVTQITLNKALYGREFQRQAVVRFGGYSDAAKQETVVISMMSQFIKEYPDVDSYAVSYSLPYHSWGALSYSRSRKIMSWGYLGQGPVYHNIYAKDFEVAASRNYDL